MPIALPPGLGETILKKTGCSAMWIGVVKTAVDRAGRVQSLDLGDVGAGPECSKALETLLKLSLATPTRIAAALTNPDVLVVKPRKRPGCFDENPLTNQVPPRRGAQRVGGVIKAPAIKRRVEPMFPDSVRREMGGGSVLLVMEAIITKTGCVREVRLLRQTPWPQLNSAAVLAASEWTFEPATLDGVPTDVIFNLTINFKIK